jgi:hypothetical protein
VYCTDTAQGTDWWRILAGSVENLWTLYNTSYVFDTLSFPEGLYSMEVTGWVPTSQSTQRLSFIKTNRLMVIPALYDMPPRTLVPIQST